MVSKRQDDAGILYVVYYYMLPAISPSVCIRSPAGARNNLWPEAPFVQLMIFGLGREAAPIILYQSDSKVRMFQEGFSGKCKYLLYFLE